MKKINVDLMRSKMPSRTPSQIVADISELLFAAEVERRTGWKSITDPALDQSGSDIQFMLDEAIIFMQVKGSSLRATGTSWTLSPFDPEKGLNKELFSLPNFFFGMVLFPCTQNPLFSSFVLPPPIFLVVSGTKVIEYFNPPRSEKSHNISISRKTFNEGRYSWLEGADDLAGIFAQEYTRQTEQR